MIPWEALDEAPIPGGGRLRLLRRGTEYVIRLDGAELMGSRVRGSEEALATLALARIAGRPAPRVLIGGLGMGFTLRAALDALPASAAVTVAELVPAVAAWVRGPLAHLSGRALEDARVTLTLDDVGAVIAAGRSTFDAILLDVDNGPDGLTRGANDRLYGAGGLGTARAALRRGGVLAVWSAAPDPDFGRRLRQVGFTVEEATPRARGTRGARHRIWLAVRS